MDSAITVMGPDQTGGLGVLRFRHPPGTFAPSPATRITLLTLAKQGDELRGVGLDWGCGIGVLAIAAARMRSVRRVVGLDLSPENVASARENAVLNGVQEAVAFAEADSFAPVSRHGQALIARLRGAVDFLVANPPHSATHDGFDFRRRVAREGADFIKPGGLLLVQALSVYGAQRVQSLAGDEYSYEGIAGRTDLVPLDLARAQLRHQLATYVREERRGGSPYVFFVAREPGVPQTATAALRALRAGDALLGRWQVHRFRREIGR